MFVNFFYGKKTVLAFLVCTLLFMLCFINFFFPPRFLLVVNDAKFNLKLVVTNRDCNNKLQETLQQLQSKVS